MHGETIKFVLTFVYFSHTWHVSADNPSHHQAILQKYKRWNW